MSDAEETLVVKLRHDKLRALGLCVNGPMTGTTSRSGRVHGKAYRGGRCIACWNAKLASERRGPEMQL